MFYKNFGADSFKRSWEAQACHARRHAMFQMLQKPASAGPKILQAMQIRSRPHPHPRNKAENMMPRKKPRAEQPKIIRAEGPAVETSLHRWGRPATDDQGRPITGKIACTKWTVLDAAYENGKLGEKGTSTANSRFNAGKTYERLWDAGQASGTDSTQAMNISRSAPTCGGSDSALRAREDIGEIHKLLGSRDRIIINRVCGLGFLPSEAVALVSDEYTKSTWPRFRESLDALIEAIDKFSKREHTNR